MAETAITTLWPWKVRELAEKESEDGVFKTLRSDVTRLSLKVSLIVDFLSVPNVVNIGAIALVTDAAIAIFGEAGVSSPTGVMTVAILLLTEITLEYSCSQSHRSCQICGQASGMAFCNTISSGKNRYISINGNAQNSWSKRKKVKKIITYI
ncbi:hypothetical protein REPUB_Repub05bG0052100 [Reevesia pubescens]